MEKLQLYQLQVTYQNNLSEELSEDAARVPPAVPDFVAVHCIATFENCPDDQLSQEYAGSLIRYLKSETHLEQNIVNTEMKHLSTRSFRNSVYVHTVEVIMLVSCARLWECPASYVRKFLGQPNLWEKSNGTLIKLSRIHQK